MPPPGEVNPSRKIRYEDPTLQPIKKKENNAAMSIEHSYDDFCNRSSGRQKAGGKGTKGQYKNPVL